MGIAFEDAEHGHTAFSGVGSKARYSAAELDEALSVTGDIYDAALDPSLWPQTLERICGFVGGMAAAMFSQDAVSGRGRFHYSWGDKPEETRLWLQKYSRLNPIAVPMMLLNAGDVRLGSQMISREQLYATRFYKEWLAHTGYGDNAIAVLEKSLTVVTCLAVVQSQDTWGDLAPARRMELLVPHARRAVAIGEVIERHKIEAGMLSDVADVLSAGVILTDDAGTVVHANAAAHAMLAAGDPILLRNAALAVRGANTCPQGAQHALIEAIDGAVRNDLIVSPRGTAIPLTAATGDRYVVHVLPLTSSVRRKAAHIPRARVAVLVHKAAVDGLLPLEAIARQFNLSPAELRVLAVVLEVGGSVPEIADVLGLSKPTVKTHLRRLFDKTDTRRQADLIRLVASYASPLIGRSHAGP